jgi:hypothetical protein
MNPNDIVKPAEIGVPIGTDKALLWVESLIKRFYVSKEAKDFIILKNGITQEILDELLPLGKYAKHHYDDPNILLKYYPGTENSFDADFININDELIERVEVTMALDGQQSRLQSESIIKFGHSSVYHTPIHSGTLKNRVLTESEGATIGSDEIIDLQVSRIQSAYEKKHKNIAKYPETTLLIGVDIPLFMEWEYQNIIERFNVLENTFHSIKCVNTSSNHCWHLK